MDTVTGWHWQPYKYRREATDVNGARGCRFPPGWFASDAGSSRRPAIRKKRRAAYAPDAALANYYDEKAHLEGMHQDKDESLAPVVSLSIGDSCTFRFGNTER